MKSRLTRIAKRSILATVSSLSALFPALGQASTPTELPCSHAETRGFDFWIGEWDIDARNRPPGVDEWSRHETWIRTVVRSGLSGCVILEESIDVIDGDTLVVGMSTTAYNAHLGEYQQLWIDGQGNIWEYLGNWEDDQMALYLESTSSDGTRQTPFLESTRIRMVFADIEDDGLTWRYEYSSDGGHTWTSTSEANYRRRD